MTALRCQTCESVWLGADAGQTMDPDGLPACLRCDGELQLMTDEQIRAHIDGLRRKKPSEKGQAS